MGSFQSTMKRTQVRPDSLPLSPDAGAIHAYQAGEISLSKAAYKAGLCFEEMRDILRKRGIRLDLGPESREEIEKEVDLLRRKLDGVHRQ